MSAEETSFQNSESAEVLIDSDIKTVEKSTLNNFEEIYATIDPPRPEKTSGEKIKGGLFVFVLLIANFSLPFWESEWSSSDSLEWGYTLSEYGIVQ